MATFMFTLSQEFKDTIDRFAGGKNVSTAQVAREALAELVGYDLSSEVDGRARKGKYANPAAKKAARKARQEAKKEEEKELMEALRKGLHNEDIRHIAASVGVKDAPVVVTKVSRKGRK